MFFSHFLVNKGLIQHVVQSCYNYNLTFLKLDIHTVKMIPISACYTSGRGNSLNRALFGLRPLHYESKVLTPGKVWAKGGVWTEGVSRKDGRWNDGVRNGGKKQGMWGGEGRMGNCLRCRGKLTLTHPGDICFSSQLNNNDHHISINKSSIIVFQYMFGSSQN